MQSCAPFRAGNPGRLENLAYQNLNDGDSIAVINPKTLKVIKLMQIAGNRLRNAYACNGSLLARGFGSLARRNRLGSFDRGY
jgi:hypothetical protein